jgi:hypothetical protein
MIGYHKLSEVEIKSLKVKLNPPNMSYPYYASPIIDGKNINEYGDIAPLSNEEFRIKQIKRKNAERIIYVSNYGRIIYNDTVILPYVVGTFLNCTKIYHHEIGDYYIYNLVKEVFDPIENRSSIQIHHIDNNALDNRLDNLIYVTEDEHRLIDSEFNKNLIVLSRRIHRENYENIIEYFRLNTNHEVAGDSIAKHFANVFIEVIKWNIDKLCERNIIQCVVKNSNLESSIYCYNNIYSYYSLTIVNIH